MGRLSAAVFGVCLVFLFYPIAAFAVTNEPSVAEAGTTASAASSQVIVVYDHDVTRSEKALIAEAVSNYGAQGKVGLSTAVLGHEGRAFQVSLRDASSAGKLLDRLDDMPGVAVAQRNYQYELADSAAGPNSIKSASASLPDLDFKTGDPLLGEQYALNSWSSTQGKGADVRSAWATAHLSPRWTEGAAEVAVLDTGIDVDHEDLVDNIDTENMAAVIASSGSNPVYRIEHGRPAADLVNDEDGHGTLVAGIVSARADNGTGVAGISYNAKILPVNVYHYSSEAKSYLTDSARLVEALGYLADLKASGKVPGLRVVNISGGGYPKDSADWEDKLLEKSIKTLADDYGVIVVCAGGNGNLKDKAYTARCLPSDFEETVAVTALDKNGYNLRYSDYNLAKDISAPGEGVLSTNNKGGYAVGSGTSMAAPVVSGVAALMWQARPDLTVAEVRNALLATANKLDPRGKNYHGPGETGSAGAIDADQAVRSVLGLSLKKVESTEPAGSSVQLKTGWIYEVAGAWYKLTSPAKLQVAFRKSARGKKIRSLTVPKSAKLPDGRTYQVSGISVGAFAGWKKLETITVCSPLLKTRRAVGDCLVGSKVKTVKIKGMSASAKKKVRRAFARYAGKRNLRFA